MTDPPSLLALVSPDVPYHPLSAVGGVAYFRPARSQSSVAVQSLSHTRVSPKCLRILGLRLWKGRKARGYPLADTSRSPHSCGSRNCSCGQQSRPSPLGCKGAFVCRLQSALLLLRMVIRCKAHSLHLWHMAELRNVVQKAKALQLLPKCCSL